MKNLMANIFGNKKSPKGEDSFDLVLGSLIYSDESWWEATVAIGERKIGFKIGGEAKPALGIISHANDIVANFTTFFRVIREFLLFDAKRLPAAAEEIIQLQIEDICLFWPLRPDDGMIYFTGPTEDRFWRCDYIQRKPKRLGFDS